MLMSNFLHENPYRVVIYARMSTKSQNPRSPDQQIEEIKRLIKRLGLPWKIVKIYRDDGISGRVTRNRPGLQTMLVDLKTERVTADLILVDTFERLTRADDADEFRRKLENQGVYVLTTDSQFADPTSEAGRALASFESFRAKAAGRVKAHDVVRGKKDGVRCGHWPGGPVPFGIQLESVYAVRNGIEEISHRLPIPDPETTPTIRRIFELANEKGWSGKRIYDHLKDVDKIPANLRPASATAITYCLKNPIYKGEYIWRKNCTGLIEEVRHVQALPEDEWEWNPKFCEPIVSQELWNAVAVQRAARKRKSDESDQEAPAFPCTTGVPLKYPLSGLIMCQKCGRAMNCSSSSAYTTVSGEERRYTSYVCQGYLNGACDNSKRIPEDKLRSAVFDVLLGQLFLTETSSS